MILLVRYFCLLQAFVFACAVHAAVSKEINPDRQALEAIYIASGGEQWNGAAGWMTDRPLHEWHGIMVRQGRVVGIDLADNGLVGGIPEAISLLTALESLDLRWNALVGSIPSALSSLGNLESVLLSGNRLSGEIPWQLGTLSNLQRLDLSNNDLTGGIPSELGNLANLRALGLHNNSLSGPIPWQLGGASRLQRLILSRNSLTGWVPPEIRGLRELTHLNLSMNEMSGPVTQLAQEAGVFELLDLRGSGLTAPALQEITELKAVTRRNFNKRNRGRSTQERAGNEINGTELFGVTTALIEDPYAREFITRVMRTIRVQDGFLKVDGADLPAGIGVDQVERAAANLNARLGVAGERIESLDDLERALEIYANGQIIVSSQVSTIPSRVRVVQNGGNGNVVFAMKPKAQGTSWRSRIAEPATVPRIVVQCDKLQPQRPHKSKEESGYIKAKFDGDCANLGTVPFQVITGTVKLELWRLQDFWFFWHPVEVESATHERRNPPQPLRWNPNTASVKAKCLNGFYFTKATISLAGSLSGTIPWYFPPELVSAILFYGDWTRALD